MNTIKGYKTLGFALLVAVVGVLQTFTWQSVIPQTAQWSGTVMIAIGAVIAALRYVTDTPIGRSS